MDEFLKEMADILEEDAVSADAELNSFESWDSLAALSVAALADSDFGVTLSAQEIKDAGTIGGLYRLIDSKKAA